ncbi:hypothetical protein [uncultured Ruminococcus sp.]|uniref:hypothetical protein n=1 Tax=uncultured Ruminococcus sp. TaxID=165186 RepID=UPI0025EFA0B9|nr:hypothetical protein [uncultured Ruminococcus sp.]
MARYIDAEKLKDSIDSQTDSIFNWGKTTEELYHDLCELVDDEPTADVQEIKHGEWQEHSGVHICSLCGHAFETEGYLAFFNYCPNCGARMDGDSE